MEGSSAIGIIEREAAAFTALLELDALDTPVPSCPGWTLADLARHLGSIHLWACEAVLRGPSDEIDGPADPELVKGWYADAAAQLVETLRTMPDEHPCWTFGPHPRTAAFWQRRQAQETTLHRWDAAAALGRPPAIDDAVAYDGLDEVVHMFLPRQLRLDRISPWPGVVELAPDGPHDPLRVAAATTDRVADAIVSGPAEALLLLLWHRAPLSDPRLAVTGDRGAVERLLALAITP